MALVAIILFSFMANLLKFIFSAIMKTARLIQLRKLRNKKTVPVKPSSDVT